MEIKKVKINIYLLSIAAILVVIQVILLNRFSTIGDKLSNMDITIHKIGEQNSQLSEKIASASSMVAISDKAKKIGFAPSANIISLSSPLPVAYDSRFTL
jgi:cell division protein FtsL